MVTYHFFLYSLNYIKFDRILEDINFSESWKALLIWRLHSLKKDWANGFYYPTWILSVWLFIFYSWTHSSYTIGYLFVFLNYQAIYQIILQNQWALFYLIHSTIHTVQNGFLNWGIHVFHQKAIYPNLTFISSAQWPLLLSLSKNTN